MLGSVFCDQVRALPRLPDREEWIFQAVADGNLVDWGWSDVVVDGRRISVANDYLAIGAPEDFVRMPPSGVLALRIGALLGYRCPTEREVIAIHRAANVKLHALPWGTKATPGKDGKPLAGDPYGALMLTVERLEAHNAEIEVQRAGRTGLVAGHKKDVLGVHADGRLAFCGWFSTDGDSEIQHDDEAHEKSYADYSHGLRFVIDLGAAS